LQTTVLGASFAHGAIQSGHCFQPAELSDKSEGQTAPSALPSIKQNSLASQSLLLAHVWVVVVVMVVVGTVSVATEL